MIDLRLGRWQDVLGEVDQVDALVTDPPYSTRTHSGHDHVVRAQRFYSVGLNRRRTIAYPPLTDDDAHAFIGYWAPRVRGWICVLTDHLLGPVFSAALEVHGRYVFSPLACVDPGSRVRLAGDGPSQWTCWLIVSRPATSEWAGWGTLRGAYQRDRRPFERSPIVGGKPLWLMQDIVSDYSRPGDLVVDPFCGSGTTAIACRRLGRSCITSEQDPETHAIARARIDLELAQLSLPGTEAAP